MTEIMLPVCPKWCELIASGKRTIEPRKTKPNCDVPFKVYIYCTNDKGISFWTGKRYAYADDRSHNLFDICGNGKVIGEFICNKIDQLAVCGSDLCNDYEKLYEFEKPEASAAYFRAFGDGETDLSMRKSIAVFKLYIKKGKAR